MLTSKARAQGASVVTTLPAEVVRRFGIRAGSELAWFEDGLGGFRVVAYPPELQAAMSTHEEIMANYDDLFRGFDV